jgi:Tfp pilus assembly protein PilX
MKRLALLSDEGGFALATAMAVLFIILTLGLVALQTVDFQSRSSSQETAGEAAFNLAESALDAETARLGTQWPGASTPWNATCNQSTTPNTGCPGTSLTQTFSSTYAGPQYTSPRWALQVFDNGWNPDTDYYSDALSAGGSNAQPNYDLNNDNKLWVRAQATIAGQTRVVVAEVVRQPHVVSLPRNVITAGGTYTSNNGNKIIINGYDSVPNSGLTGSVDLRCGAAPPAPPTPAVYGDLCAGWNADQGQLSPPTYSTGYTDPAGGGQTLQPAQLIALENTASANNTLYNGACPPPGTPGVVVVENPPGGGCSYNSNTTWNSDAAPGMLLFVDGWVYFSGTMNFYGIIYMADEGGQPGPCTSSALQADEAKNGGNPIFSVHGTGTLYGALFVGNCGVVDAGSSAWNIQFDSNAFNGVVAYATPALAKNTFQIVAHP